MHSLVDQSLLASWLDIAMLAFMNRSIIYSLGSTYGTRPVVVLLAGGAWEFVVKKDLDHIKVFTQNHHHIETETIKQYSDLEEPFCLECLDTSFKKH